MARACMKMREKCMKASGKRTKWTERDFIDLPTEVTTAETLSRMRFMDRANIAGMTGRRILEVGNPARCTLERARTRPRLTSSGRGNLPMANITMARFFFTYVSFGYFVNLKYLSVRCSCLCRGVHLGIHDHGGTSTHAWLTMVEHSCCRMFLSLLALSLLHVIQYPTPRL